MRKYRVIVEYEKYISYTVEAENHDEARKKYLLGEGNREWVGPKDNSHYSPKDGWTVSIEELIPDSSCCQWCKED